MSPKLPNSNCSTQAATTGLSTSTAEAKLRNGSVEMLHGTCKGEQTILLLLHVSQLPLYFLSPIPQPPATRGNKTYYMPAQLL